MVQYILIFDQNAATHQQYVTALKELSLHTGERYIVTTGTFADIPFPNERPLNFVIAVVRDNKQGYRFIPHLCRLVDAHNILLLVDHGVSTACINDLASLGCLVADLPAEVANLRATMATLLVQMYPRQKSEQRSWAMYRREEIVA